ncbi:hypothetical protein H5410_021795 [Solanum commersonii]|uniref:DUF4283 domain-containing protein n=1 Tax=Solanum commersonii TaxID=4109 RepID=A0A9J5ZCZ3_SOLCO|nr:hypothetical protein H5410_021795 [Solanum commersonii]
MADMATGQFSNTGQSLQNTTLTTTSLINFPKLYHSKSPNKPIEHTILPTNCVVDPKVKYVDLLKPANKRVIQDLIALKTMEYSNEIPRISWTEDEVDKMNVIEGECKIGLLRHRHILMRFNLREDFVNVLSKNAYYIMGKDGIAYQMRPFIYDANFKPEEETTQAMA